MEHILASMVTSRPACCSFSTDSLAIRDFDLPTCFFWNKNWRFRFETSIVSKSITVRSVKPKDKNWSREKKIHEKQNEIKKPRIF